MKKFISSAVLLMTVLTLNAQFSGFTGDWKINRDKSNVPADMLFLSQIAISIKGDSILTKRTYTDPNYQEYPFEEKLSLNGEEAKIFIYDMPRVAKAQKRQDGTIFIESRTTFYGGAGEESLVTRETWKSDGKILTLDQVHQMSGQEFTGVFVYDKVK